MKVISNIKAKFGQDITYVQGQISYLNAQLSRLMLDPVVNAKDITYTRGKLLKFMQQEIDLTPAGPVKNTKKQMLNYEINKHKQQINTRISSNKISKKHKLSTEIGLKLKKTVNSYKQIGLSTNGSELAAGIVSSVGNTLSTAVSVAKVPAIGVTKVVKGGSTIAAQIVLSPLHVPAYLFAKLINPDAPYKGRAIGSMSKGLENLLNSSMDLTETMIRRI